MFEFGNDQRDMLDMGNLIGYGLYRTMVRENSVAEETGSLKNELVTTEVLAVRIGRNKMAGR